MKEAISVIHINKHNKYDMYRIIPQQIPQARRAEINAKILNDIDSGRGLVPKETVYNCYTGAGGLHGLKREDYANYNEYSIAKKEFELGQFFTPPQVCRMMTGIIMAEPDEMALDMCCGTGGFFNFLPNLHNAYGFDIDERALKVARHLYPEASLERCDIRHYSPRRRADIVIGNPPFGLDFDGERSQWFYCMKAREVLVPSGFFIFVAPCSFLQSEFWNKREVETLNSWFSFAGQTKLPYNAFSSAGIDSIETKIMVFTRLSENIQAAAYRDDEFITAEELKERVAAIRKIKKQLRVKISLETRSAGQEENSEFEYRAAKYLYELKAHPRLQKHLDKATALVSRYRNQMPPRDCTNEEYKKWERSKLTTAKVLSTLYRYIRRQNSRPRKEARLVRTSYGFRLKGRIPDITTAARDVKMYDLVVHGSGLPGLGAPEPTMVPPPALIPEGQYRQAMKTVERKRREYLRQSTPFDAMEHDPALEAYTGTLGFFNKEMAWCGFTELQKRDMGLIFQKRYALLNWQQGSGKTAVAWHYGKYLLMQGKVKNVVVLAPSIAVNLTWGPFLKRNNEKYIIASSWKDFTVIPDGTFIVVSLSVAGKLERYLKRLVKLKSRRICLLFDESDEITNPAAQRTRLALDIFRRVRYKLLATGTTTRNNVAELYPQLELLYNNSMNLMCRCAESYHENDDREITSEPNPYCGQPFPARGGAALFKSCFCPGRATVFGIEKQNQDIYNRDELFLITGKTVLTRKFREFAGDKYGILTHAVTPSAGETEVYRTILKEFCRICELYFESTGDSRKEAALKMIRQIKLLVRACSVPSHMPGYYGPPFGEKARYIAALIDGIQGKTAVGCTSIEAMEMYEDYLSLKFPTRPVFIIRGDVNFKKREQIIARFEATRSGILVCTQQSLKSSANIPSCNEVILESLQWNIPRMEQFYFRFIRLDSKDHTRVHFVTYQDSIEQNIMALVLTKERLNEFIKSGEVKKQSEIFEEFGISMSVIEGLLKRYRDSEGKLHITWGRQTVNN